MQALKPVPRHTLHELPMPHWPATLTPVHTAGLWVWSSSQVSPMPFTWPMKLDEFDTPCVHTSPVTRQSGISWLTFTTKEFTLALVKSWDWNCKSISTRRWIVYTAGLYRFGPQSCSIQPAGLVVGNQKTWPIAEFRATLALAIGSELLIASTTAATRTGYAP